MRAMKPVPPTLPPSRKLDEGNLKHALIGYWVFVATFLTTVLISALIAANESGVL
ncbi:hypothetical protein F353_gp24 [Vibrio phage CP-T1]|uniref:hypothetical protein n=1 Tax=Vibrio phage CP-T1 TaxID=10689 RepID=UPI0002536CA8|nr:hypothetical protein F353_gp24 [Vibrio phage CP-T1]AFC22406.1 hypothetical protein CP-T1_0024 [Vibrio phage CP-T1]AIA08740.1 hypothetical protein SBVc24_0051 [Vibrio phage 24]